MLGGAGRNRTFAASVEDWSRAGRGWPALAKTRGRRRDDEVLAARRQLVDKRSKQLCPQQEQPYSECTEGKTADALVGS